MQKTRINMLFEKRYRYLFISLSIDSVSWSIRMHELHRGIGYWS